MYLHFTSIVCNFKEQYDDTFSPATFSSEMRLSGTEGTLNSAIFTHLSKYKYVRLEGRRKAEAVATGSKNVKLSISLQTQSYIGFQHSLTTFVVADRGVLGTEICSLREKLPPLLLLNYITLVHCTLTLNLTNLLLI